ncbi:hypothetical protein DFH08DRAFT_971072 [Mycena albidolilacea]|uniref:Uncharacterized protein n=1 Tax=Mycena albidolilacea TaxID=1033008 RepID=A0AAD7EFB1_9AGAR|nr:hypothetical protein DFH08DRAFT_971072 [Mycena albidolilacea]
MSTSDAPPAPDVPKQKCSACKCMKPLTAEYFARKGTGFMKTCLSCRNRDRKREQAAKGQEPREPASAADDDYAGLSCVDFEDFIAVIAMDESVRSFSAFVDATVLGKQGKGLAQAIVAEISECIDYKFNYHSKYDQKESDCTRYMYHCAQNGTRQLNPIKAEDGEKKQRDRRQMITFDCKGWLFITVDTTSNFAFVNLQHELDHVPYHRKEVPAKVKEYVVVNPRLTAPQIWLWVLSLPEYRDTAKIPFSRRAVYHLWAKLNRETGVGGEDTTFPFRAADCCQIKKRTRGTCANYKRQHGAQAPLSPRLIPIPVVEQTESIRRAEYTRAATRA